MACDDLHEASGDQHRGVWGRGNREISRFWGTGIRGFGDLGICEDVGTKVLVYSVLDT